MGIGARSVPLLDQNAALKVRARRPQTTRKSFAPFGASMASELVLPFFVQTRTAPPVVQLAWKSRAPVGAASLSPTSRPSTDHWTKAGGTAAGVDRAA